MDSAVVGALGITSWPAIFDCQPTRLERVLQRRVSTICHENALECSGILLSGTPQLIIIVFLELAPYVYDRLFASAEIYSLKRNSRNARMDSVMMPVKIARWKESFEKIRKFRKNENHGRSMSIEGNLIFPNGTVVLCFW